MKSFYEKNIDALIKINPSLGASLFSIQQNERFEVFQGKDALDINILDTKLNDFIYNEPLSELTTTAELMNDDYGRYPVLFFYGIGNGLLLRALLENESLEHLIVIEPNIELIYIALNFIDIAKEIETQRVIILISDEVNFTTTLNITGKKYVKPYAKIYDLHSQSVYYEKNYKEDMNNINNLFIRSYKHIVISHGNDAIDALIGIEQHIANLPKMLEGYKTSNFLKGI